VHSIDLISTLAGSFAAALLAGYATQRLGLSPIVGYLFAGILVGPHTPGFVADQHLAEQLAEIGVILLMFGVGLQFHVEELLAVRRVAIPGALVQSGVTTALGAVLAHWFGWTWGAGVVFGVALSVASTVVLIRVLTDSRHLHTPAGHIAVGWLVVEDLLTVLVLVLMTAFFGTNRQSGLALTIGLATLKVGALVLFTMVAGTRLIPWLLTRVAATRSRELFTLCVLVLALGIAVVSAAIFGVSMALGAFLAGLVVARSDFSVRAASEALPMRDAFAVLFFVSVGMLLNPLQVLEEPLLLVAALAIVLIGKPLAALGITLAVGYPLRVSLAVAVALAQVGEFSFIVANLGASLNVISPAATNTLIACAIASITLNPLLYRLVDPVATWWSGVGNGPVSTEAPAETPAVSRHRAVVVGYGPVGRTVTRLLRENQIAPTVVELNMNTVKDLKSSGIRAVYGDANHLATLEEAGARHARSVIFTVSGMRAAEESIRLVRELNPRVQILARTAYLKEREALRKAGADEVFSGEGEVALTLTESILASLGATAEQIDRERARVHADLS
jgi:CPA2 family monovalent cation:H+ antiporter-2